MFSGFALADETDLSSLTFGNGWKIDTSKEYVGDQYKRFDGLEFTRIVNTSGFDLPEGMTIDDNDRVWMFTLITGLQPKTLWSAAGDAFNQKKSAAITSGEIPDLMQVDMNQYYALVKAGLLADLTDELTGRPASEPAGALRHGRQPRAGHPAHQRPHLRHPGSVHEL